MLFNLLTPSHLLLHAILGRSIVLAAIFAIVLTAAPSRAAELLPELGRDAVLLRPDGKPRGAIILMAGGDGLLDIAAEGEITRLKGNLLIRTRQAFVRGGFATLALSSSGDLGRAMEAMRRIARPVIVVGTSRAATRMARAPAADGIVIISGMLDALQGDLGPPEALPPLLVIHHRQDRCRVTPPALVPAFERWAAGRAHVVWLDGGRDDGGSCRGNSHHGLAGIEGGMIAAVLGFAGKIRPR